MDEAAARPAMRRRLWPPVVAVAAVAVFAVALVGYPSADPLILWVILEVGVGIAAFVGVGALLAERRPDNPIGPVLLATGSLMSLTLASGAYAGTGAAAMPDPWPGSALAQMLSENLFAASVGIGLIVIPLIFPDGRFLSRPWRLVAWVAATAWCLAVASSVILPGPVSGLDLVNPVGIPGTERLSRTLGVLGGTAAGVAFVAAGGSMWLRFRRGTQVERQQLKWLLAVVVYAALVYPPAFIFLGRDPLSIVGWSVVNTSFVALPVAIGIAVLRYRLYDIDRIISRTIAWAVVTAVLVGAFAGLVIAFTSLLQPFTGASGLGVAGATLAVAALFQPLRRRVQRTVDRHFNRSHIDAELTLNRLSNQLRGEVDLDSIGAAVVSTVDAAVQPAGSGLWIRSARDSSHAARSAQAHSVPATLARSRGQVPSA